MIVVMGSRMEWVLPAHKWGGNMGEAAKMETYN